MDTLSAFLFATFVVMLGHYHWKRMRMYRMAANISGPDGWPLVGIAPMFFGKLNFILMILNDLLTRYPSPVKLWIGQRLLFGVTDPKHIEIVFNHPDCLAKHSYYHITKRLVGDGLFVAPVPMWKKNRKLISPAFNQRILNSYMPVFNEKAQELVNALRKHVDEDQEDALCFFAKCMLDVAVETSMGIKMDNTLVSQELHHCLTRMFKTVIKCLFQFPYNVDFIYNNTPLKLPLEKDVKWFHNYVDKVILEKLEAKKISSEYNAEFPEAEIKEKIKMKSFLELLLDLTDDEHFTIEHIKDEVSVMLVGGVDTVATTLAFVMVMLGMHQDVQQRVYQEIINVLGHDRPMDTTDVQNFNYLERVIKETMRLFPIGPALFRENEADIDLGDYVLPKGSGTMIFCFRTHRDPKYWPEPFKFDPDRFLPEEVAKRHPYAYVPYAGGPRMCIGHRYALMCMKTIIANVVRKLRITTPYKRVEDIRVNQPFVLTSLDGIKLKVSLRD